MHWQVLIPVLVAAVLILSHIFGKAEQPRRRPPGAGAPGPGGRPQSEIERFLEEISKMKQRSAEQAQAASVEERRPTPPRPVPVPVRTERVPVPVRRTEAPRVRPVEVMVATPPPAPLPAVVVAPAVVSLASLPPVAVSLSPSRVSPAVASLRSLLRSPQSLRTAVLLQEVFGAAALSAPVARLLIYRFALACAKR